MNGRTVLNLGSGVNLFDSGCGPWSDDVAVAQPVGEKIMVTWVDFKKSIKLSEGEIPHMYLDTVGAVTVGVGNMIPDAASATSLGFVDRKTGKPATKEAVQAEFAAVKAQPKGLVASAYRKHTQLDLPQSAIDTLLDSRIAGFKKDLAVRFPKFNTYPTSSQMALTDMAFNLGTSGLVTKFPTFKKAVDAGDWTKAAAESNRPQVSVARNKQVKSWLEEGAKTK